MKEYFIENEFVQYRLEDGVIFADFKPNLNVFSLEVAKEVVNTRLKFMRGVSRPVVIDFNNIVSADKETRRYFAGEEATSLVSAAAFMKITNTATLMMTNLFLKFNKPTVPTRFFNNKEEALTWLEDYKQVNSKFL